MSPSNRTVQLFVTPACERVRIWAVGWEQRHRDIVTHLRTPLHAVPEHTNTESAIILGRALVQPLKVDGVFERAVLNETSLGNMPVVPGHAHGKSKKRFGVGIQLLRAELDYVPKALLRAMLAGHTVVICWPSDEGQGEVDLAVGFLHRREHEISKTVLFQSADVRDPSQFVRLPSHLDICS